MLSNQKMKDQSSNLENKLQDQSCNLEKMLKDNLLVVQKMGNKVVNLER